MKDLKILSISDTHGFHRDLKIDKDTDMIIHSGDASNSKDPYKNLPEMIDFLNWFDSLPIKYKIFVAGNHDTSIEAKLTHPSNYIDIIYLEHSSIEIEGIKIFGSPYTPEFHNWAFNVRRDRLHNYWEAIPDDTDILVTHGPPKGILDIAYKNHGGIEYCGDEALRKRIKIVNPQFHCFGHIHLNEDNYNAGYRQVQGLRTTFINASCVTDNEFGKGLSSQGYYFTIKSNNNG